MTRLARNLLRIALALSAPILAVTLLELGCRISGLGHPTRFLIPFERGGEQVWVDNQLFGYRFFAPAVSRAPAPIVIPRQKPPGEFRVVVLGESAAMGEPEPAYGPPRVLEYLLAARMPDRKITVINAAMTAINSHVIREIARDISKLQPDAVVVYVGNNEVVGPYGPGTVFHSHVASAGLNRLRVILSRLRLVSALRSAWFGWKGGDHDVWRGMEMFASLHVPSDDTRLRAVYRSFESNLQAIIEEIQSVGAIPVLSTIAVNLSDQAPFDGRVMEHTDIEYLKKMRDEDALRFRADSTINHIIRAAALRNSAIQLIDAETGFEAAGALGYPDFIDHVHFSIEGSYRLARLWADALTRSTNDAPSLAALSDRLQWNPYNAIDIAETMYSRSSRPPFSQTADHEQRMLMWASQKVLLYRAAGRIPMDDVIARHHKSMTAYPDDIHFPQQAVRVLLMEDRFQEAGELLYRIHQMAPHRADIRGWMCIFAAIAGRTDRVWSIMTEHAPDLGQLPADMLTSAADTLMQSGYRDESLHVLDLATRQYPKRIRMQTMYASRLAQSGQIEAAQQRFRRLIDAHPKEAWIKEEFAILQAMTGDADGAAASLRHLRESPHDADQIKWIQLLIYQGRYEEAEKRLLSIVHTNADKADAWRMLARTSAIQQRLQQSVQYMYELIRLEPWQGANWLQLGQMLEQMNQPNEAVEAYEHALPLLVEPEQALAGLNRLAAYRDAEN